MEEPKYHKVPLLVVTVRVCTPKTKSDENAASQSGYTWKTVYVQDSTAAA